MFTERLHDLWLRLKAVVKRRQLDRDLAEELEFHLAMREQKLVEQGLSPHEAHRAARHGFGNAVALKESSRALWSFPSLESIFQDIRYGLRQLRRSPSFTALAVLTLALGIGGTTAIFSVVYGAVLKPFPYRDSERLVVLVSHNLKENRDGGWAWVSTSEFRDYREQNHVFEEVIGGTGADLLLTGRDTPQWFGGNPVTCDLFQVLGVAPLLGRSITPGDCQPGAQPVVVLNHKVWQGYFGGDSKIIGQTLILNHQPKTVIAVMPPRFGWQDGDMWLPGQVSRDASPGDNYCVVGHLKPGVTIEQANADVAVLAKRFAKTYPKDHPPEMTVRVESLADAAVGDVSKSFYVFLGAVGLLLLIACVNVANLTLARATGREKEIAVRAALGAARGRLVRQFLIESLLLALIGAALASLAAWSGLGKLVAIIPPEMIPSEAAIQVNGAVLLFTLGTAILSTLLFGLAPALLTVARAPQSPLKASGRASGESVRHHRLRGFLVVCEVALSIVLLTGAGLLVRSFVALRHVDLGYNPENVLWATAVLPEDRYKTVQEKNQYHMEALRTVRALPGVASAALSGPGMLFPFPVSAEIAGAADRTAYLRFAGDGLFETMGIRLLRGRAISEEDVAQGRRVAVVSPAFVNEFWRNVNPLGHQFKLKPSHFLPAMKEESFEVIGEAADIRSTVAAGGPAVQPAVFIPYSTGGLPWLGLMIRARVPVASLTRPVQQALAPIDKELPVSTAVLKENQNNAWFSTPRFITMMLAAFAALGLALVSLGVYSVLAYAVSRRTHEIGVRMALGAKSSNVRRMVMASGLRWLLIGIGIGVPASIAFAKILQNKIWGLKSADPLTLVAVSAVMIVVGVAACYFPARLATIVDPMVALRCE